MVALLLIAVAGVLIAIYKWATRFSLRTANDVYPFLRKVDMEALNGTFHPEAEQSLRDQLPAEEFKKVQWKRFHLAIYYCDMLSHNAKVFQGWTRYERRQSWGELIPAERKTLKELQTVALQCRLSALVIRLRLRWWLVRSALLPFAALPSFENLLESGSAHMIAYYEKMASLATLFSLIYGKEYHQKFLQAL
jgi:hypothetical protein